MAFSSKTGRLLLSSFEIKERIIHRAKLIDAYVFTWWIIEAGIVLYCLFHYRAASTVPAPNYLCLIIVGIRVIEILQVSINAALFDELSERPYPAKGAKIARTVVLSGFNYLEFVMCFGVIYASYLSLIPGALSPASAFYFSFITQLTIGYGDVAPKGILRIVAALQGMIATLFLIVVLGRLASALKSDEFF